MERKATEVEIKDIAGYANVRLVKIVGNLDMVNAGSLSQKIESCIEKECPNLIFDLQEVNFIDSHGNLVLIKAHIKARKKGGSIKLFGINKNIREILDIIGLAKLIPVYKFYEEALASFKE